MPELSDALGAAFDVDLEREENLEAIIGDPNVEPERREQAEAQRFRVTDMRRATWAMGRLRAALEQIGEIEGTAAEQRRLIDAWAERETGLLRRRAEYFEGLLTEWHAAVLAEDPNRKTVRLPGGELKARKAPDGVEIESTEQFIAWALTARPEFVRTTTQQSVSLPLVKQAVLKDGEALPGVTVRHGLVNHSVAVAAADDFADMVPPPSDDAPVVE